MCKMRNWKQEFSVIFCTTAFRYRGKGHLRLLHVASSSSSLQLPSKRCLVWAFMITLTMHRECPGSPGRMPQTARWLSKPLDRSGLHLQTSNL